MFVVCFAPGFMGTEALFFGLIFNSYTGVNAENTGDLWTCVLPDFVGVSATVKHRAHIDTQQIELDVDLRGKSKADSGNSGRWRETAEGAEKQENVYLDQHNSTQRPLLSLTFTLIMKRQRRVKPSRVTSLSIHKSSWQAQFERCFSSGKHTTHLVAGLGLLLLHLQSYSHLSETFILFFKVKMLLMIRCHIKIWEKSTRDKNKQTNKKILIILFSYNTEKSLTNHIISLTNMRRVTACALLSTRKRGGDVDAQVSVLCQKGKNNFNTCFLQKWQIVLSVRGRFRGSTITWLGQVNSWSCFQTLGINSGQKQHNPTMWNWMHMLKVIDKIIWLLRTQWRNGQIHFTNQR